MKCTSCTITASPRGGFKAHETSMGSSSLTFSTSWDAVNHGDTVWTHNGGWFSGAQNDDLLAVWREAHAALTGRHGCCIQSEQSDGAVWAHRVKKGVNAPTMDCTENPSAVEEKTASDSVSTQMALATCGSSDSSCNVMLQDSKIIRQVSLFQLKY
jgi:hypothetical protein